MDSGLDSWTGLWTEIWTRFWTDAQGNDDHFQQLLVLKHVEVELIISLEKLVRGASPQGIGHQVETWMQRKIVSFPAPFQAHGAGDERLNKL